MTYIVQKKKQLVEELELRDESGEKVTTIYVRLDRDGLAEKLSARQVDLIQAQKNLLQLQQDCRKKSTLDYEKALEETGQAVIALFKAVFGQHDSDVIREFYKDNTMQMCSEVMPFITEVILPQVRKLGQAKRKSIKNSYKQKKFF